MIVKISYKNTRPIIVPWIEGLGNPYGPDHHGASSPQWGDRVTKGEPVDILFEEVMKDVAFRQVLSDGEVVFDRDDITMIDDAGMPETTILPEDDETVPVYGKDGTVKVQGDKGLFIKNGKKYLNR